MDLFRIFQSKEQLVNSVVETYSMTNEKHGRSMEKLKADIRKEAIQYEKPDLIVLLDNWEKGVR